jgi:AcrR family transcriptional regulator
MTRTHGRARAMTAPRRRRDARERIERTAYELFSRNGIRAVGVDTVCAHAGVAKMTLYRYYASKDDLAVAFLRRREEVWTRSWLMREVTRRAGDPVERLLAVFAIYDQWFRRANFEGCSFMSALLEKNPHGHPVRAAAVRHIQTVREFLAGLAKEAGIRDARRFATQWLLLMQGSVVTAHAGDRSAAQHARELGLLLLSQATAQRAGVRRRERQGASNDS